MYLTTWRLNQNRQLKKGPNYVSDFWSNFSALYFAHRIYLKDLICLHAAISILPSDVECTNATPCLNNCFTLSLEGLECQPRNSDFLVQACFITTVFSKGAMKWFIHFRNRDSKILNMLYLSNTQLATSTLTFNTWRQAWYSDVDLLSRTK